MADGARVKAFKLRRVGLQVVEGARPPASIRTCAARRPDSIAGLMPSPLSGYASPAASPIVRAPGATSGRLPAPEARYAWPRHRPGRGADRASAFEPGDELPDMAVEVAAIAAADADIEVVALGDTPRVPFEIPAEVQLRRQVTGDGVPAHTKLRFLGHDRRRGVRAATQVPGDRTEVPAGANEDRRLDRLVGNPGRAGPRRRSIAVSSSTRAPERRSRKDRTHIGESRS